MTDAGSAGAQERRNVEVGGSIGSYSSAVVAGGFCFVSGQAALDPSGQKIDAGIADQTRSTIRNMESVLRAAGYELRDVVKVNCYLSDMDDWSVMDEVFREYFGDHPPARATVRADLIYGCLVEMESVAWKP